MSINHTATIELLRLLNDGEYTRNELQERTGFASATITKWLKTLKAKKLIYVCEWRRGHQTWAAVYAWGYEQPSVPRPKPLTNTESSRRHRERVRVRLLSGVVVERRV